MRIYQRLESLLKFRIYNNAEIPEYLKRLSNMGKLDEVRKQALIILILTKLGEIEDNEESKSVVSYDIPVERPSITEIPVNPKPIETNSSNISFKCPDCPMVAKSKLGLSSHIRHRHKK